MKLGRYVATAVALAAVVATASPALAASREDIHTLHYTLVNTGVHMFGNSNGTEIGDATSNGKVAAYYELDFTASQDHAALALNNGFLYGHFTINTTTGSFAGTITGGTGSYTNDTGKITGEVTSSLGGTMTITYH